MRTFLYTLLLLLYAAGTQAQVQRLVILPQKATITPAGGHLRAMGADYFLDEPGYESTAHAYPVYDQLYDVGSVTASVNGKPYPGGLKALAGGPQPLLVLEAHSAGDIEVHLNPRHPLARTVKTIGLEASAPGWIGTRANDSDLLLAKVVWYNYGPYMSPFEFSRRSKCLDILNANGRMHFSTGLKLDAQSTVVMNRLYGLYVLDVFNGASFRAFLKNKLIVIDGEGLLTPASADFMNHAVAYYWCVQDKRALVNIRCNDTAALLNNQRLIVPQNQLLVDTMINGQQYVLIQSWQDSAFASGIQTGNGMPYYLTDSVFFSPITALFVTLAPDMNLWYDSIHGASLSMQELRYRISDVLGMPPYSDNDLFVEFWAKPQDIFRPAPDSSTSIATLTQKSDPAYLEALNNYIVNSYKGPSLLDQYPFAAIGLTYDCAPNNPSHIGLSEFVIRQSRTLYVRTVLSTAQYFNRTP